MANSCTVQVLLKADPVQQTLIGMIPSTLLPLAPSSVRAQTSLISLTANNLSYASSGTFLHWWDTYPVPSSAPAPYNDTGVYGILVTWGYATVLESNIPSIPIGCVIWGTFPASTLPIDLLLEAARIEDHWIEISTHRKLVMPLYQRYIITTPPSRTPQKTEKTLLNGVPYVPGTPASTDPSPSLSRMALTSILATWEAAYLLNCYIFPSGPLDSPCIHPLGTAIPWTASDSNLREAVVVSLAAGSKTSKAFTHQLLSNRPNFALPLGLLEVTSSTSISTSNLFERSPFPRKTVTYAELTTFGTLTWLTAQNPARIVILDFGGRDSAVERLHSALLDSNSSPSEPPPQVLIVNIGKEARIHSASDLATGAAQTAKLGKVQMNTSGVREAAIERVGEERYFKEKDEAWEKFVKDPDGADGVVKVILGKGMRGDDGIEGGWRKLCAGGAKGDEGLAFVL